MMFKRRAELLAENLPLSQEDISATTQEFLDNQDLGYWEWKNRVETEQYQERRFLESIAANIGLDQILSEFRTPVLVQHAAHEAETTRIQDELFDRTINDGLEFVKTGDRAKFEAQQIEAFNSAQAEYNAARALHEKALSELEHLRDEFRHLNEQWGNARIVAESRAARYAEAKAAGFAAVEAVAAIYLNPKNGKFRDISSEHGTRESADNLMALRERWSEMRQDELRSAAGREQDKVRSDRLLAQADMEYAMWRISQENYLQGFRHVDRSQEIAQNEALAKTAAVRAAALDRQLELSGTAYSVGNPRFVDYDASLGVKEKSLEASLKAIGEASRAKVASNEAERAQNDIGAKVSDVGAEVQSAEATERQAAIAVQEAKGRLVEIEASTAAFRINREAVEGKLHTPEQAVAAAAEQFQGSTAKESEWQAAAEASQVQWSENREQLDPQTSDIEALEQEGLHFEEVDKIHAELDKKTIENGMKLAETGDRQGFDVSQTKALEAATLRYEQASQNYKRMHAEWVSLKSEFKTLSTDWNEIRSKAEQDRIAVVEKEGQAREARKQIVGHYLNPESGKIRDVDDFKVRGSIGIDGEYHRASHPADIALQRARHFNERQRDLTEAATQEKDPIIRDRIMAQRDMEMGLFKADQADRVGFLTKTDRSHEVMEYREIAENAAVRAAQLDFEIERKGLQLDATGSHPVTSGLDRRQDLHARGLLGAVDAINGFRDHSKIVLMSEAREQAMARMVHGKGLQVENAAGLTQEARKELLRAVRPIDRQSNVEVEKLNYKQMVEREEKKQVRPGAEKPGVELQHEREVAR